MKKEEINNKLDTAINLLNEVKQLLNPPKSIEWNELSPKQIAVMESIHRLNIKLNRNPSIRELQRELGLKYVRSVEQFITSLEKKGFVGTTGGEYGLYIKKIKSNAWVYKSNGKKAYSIDELKEEKRS